MSEHDTEFMIFDRGGFKHLLTRVVHGYKMVNTKVTRFYPNDGHPYDNLFQIIGHHDKKMCEALMLLYKQTHDSAYKDGQNNIRNKFNTLMELEE